MQQLGLEQLRPEISASHWLPDKFYGNAANIKEDQTDRAATRLLRHLSVTSDPRAYLIKVRYTASDPALAVVIANAFVAEFLRSSKLQTLSQQRSSAEATLSRQLAKFGVKYPRVAQTRMVLAATDDLLKDQLSKVPEAILQAAGENVTKAIVVPSSLTLPFLIGLNRSRNRYRSCSLAGARQVVEDIFPILCQAICLRVRGLGPASDLIFGHLVCVGSREGLGKIRLATSHIVKFSIRISRIPYFCCAGVIEAKPSRFARYLQPEAAARAAGTFGPSIS